MFAGRQLKPGDEFAGYRIERRRGSGSFGAVYEAREKHADGWRQIALKVIDPDGGSDRAAGRARFLREASALAAGHHPHIVPVYAAAEHDGLLYLTMPLLPGDLDDEITRRGTLEEAVAGRIALQIASALHAAHTWGIVHRDVKPANVLIYRSGTEPHAYLADFGLARSDGATALTMAGDVLGTPRYMAPEQLRGEPATAASDVFAAGLILHEMLVGEPRCRRSDCPGPLAGPVATSLHAVAGHACQPEPSARPDAGALGQALAVALAGRAGGAETWSAAGTPTPSAFGSDGFALDAAPSLDAPGLVTAGPVTPGPDAPSRDAPGSGGASAAASTGPPRQAEPATEPASHRRSAGTRGRRLLLVAALAVFVLGVPPALAFAVARHDSHASRPLVVTFPTPATPGPVVSPSSSALATSPAPSGPAPSGPATSSPAVSNPAAPASAPSTASATGESARPPVVTARAETAPASSAGPPPTTSAAAPTPAPAAPATSAPPGTTQVRHVCAETATLRSAPGSGTTVIATLGRSTEFDGDGEYANNKAWAHGYAPSVGLSGWMLTQYVAPTC